MQTETGCWSWSLSAGYWWGWWATWAGRRAGNQETYRIQQKPSEGLWQYTHLVLQVHLVEFLHSLHKAIIYFLFIVLQNYSSESSVWCFNQRTWSLYSSKMESCFQRLLCLTRVFALSHICYFSLARGKPALKSVLFIIQVCVQRHINMFAVPWGIHKL